MPFPLPPRRPRRPKHAGANALRHHHLNRHAQSFRIRSPLSGFSYWTNTSGRPSFSPGDEESHCCYHQREYPEEGSLKQAGLFKPFHCTNVHEILRPSQPQARKNRPSARRIPPPARRPGSEVKGHSAPRAGRGKTLPLSFAFTRSAGWLMYFSIRPGDGGSTETGNPAHSGINAFRAPVFPFAIYIDHDTGEG